MLNVLKFIEKYGLLISIVLLLNIFIHTCGDPNKSVNKRLDLLTFELDSMHKEVAKHPTYQQLNTALKIEGLKTEKRMIQSTDRSILDVTRQATIDSEIQKYEKNNEK